MAPSRSLWRAFCGLLIVHKNSGFSPPQPRCKHGGAPRRGAALKSSQSTEVLEALATLQPERDLGAVQAANKAKGGAQGWFDSVLERSRDDNVAPALVAGRNSARSLFESGGVVLPGRKQEPWRFTNLKTIWSSANPTTNAKPTTTTDAEPKQGVLVKVRNGVVEGGHAAEGVFIGSVRNFSVEDASIKNALSAALPELEAEQAEARRNSAMGASSWSALNKACAADALIIHVAAGVTGPEVFVESTVEAGVVAHPRFIVSLGAGASLKLTQTFDGEGNSASNVWTTFNLGANATLKHASVAAGHVHLEHVSASLLDGASFSSSTVSFEADFARVGVDVAHDGAYSTSSLKGLQLGAARQALDYRTQVRHEAPNCDSFQDIRNVVGGNAHVTFKGRIAVPRLGQKTDAKQLCRSLLLSDDCTLDAMPSLEIVADDVKCAHGATVADLDDDMYFYLISRGLDTQEAKALLVRGFCGSILQAIEAETPLPTSTLSNFNSKLEALVKLEAKA